MTEHFVRLGARHFSALASGDPVLWSEVIGAKVTHADYGAGEIVAVEQRLNYTPLITLQFANALKTWTVQSFDNDKTWISLDPSLIARAESMATASEITTQSSRARFAASCKCYKSSLAQGRKAARINSGVRCAHDIS